MSKYVVIQDEDKCKKCGACLAKCKKSNHFAARVRMLNSVLPHLPNKLGTHHFSFLTCRHCEDPKCVGACQHNAMQRTEDGVVRVVSELCIGCSECVTACPWHIPNVIEGSIAVKCNLCDGRGAQGELPECVQFCPRKALRLVRVTDFPLQGRPEYAQANFMRNFLKG